MDDLVLGLSDTAHAITARELALSEHFQRATHADEEHVEPFERTQCFTENGWVEDNIVNDHVVAGGCKRGYAPYMPAKSRMPAALCLSSVTGGCPAGITQRIP
jgi:hypothetical protein